MNLVFDIGGTTSRTALCDRGRIIQSSRVDTPSFLNRGSGKEITDGIAQIVADGCREYAGNFSKIGISYAGPVSGDGQPAPSAVIYGRFSDECGDIRSAVQSVTGDKNVVFANDLTAAAYRYIHDYDSFCLITVSSGIGNKFVFRGKIQTSDEGIEGEIGHIPAPFYDGYDIKCSCGKGENHIGMISSGRGAEILSLDCAKNKYRSEYAASVLNGTKMTSRDIAHAADCGDGFAMLVINDCMKPLAYCCSLYLTSMYLDRIIFMGGFVQNCEYCIEAIRENAARFGVFGMTSDQIRQKMILAPNDDNHGVIGMDILLDVKKKNEK